MKRLATPLLLTSVATSQVVDIDPNTDQSTETTTASNQGQIDDGNTYITTKVAIIPKGATEHNEEGFYLDGDYSTVTDQYGEIFFEVNLHLHHDHLPQVNDGIYMIWLQAIDPKLSTVEATHYEGFSCAIRYDATIGTLIRSNFLIRTGYVGTQAMEYAVDSYDRLLRTEQTEEYPWLMQENKTYFQRNEDDGLYGEVCSMKRDFETTYSNIPLKGNGVYKLNAGFKLWEQYEQTTPSHFGHKQNVEWVVAEAAEGADLGLATSLLALNALLILTTSF